MHQITVIHKQLPFDVEVSCKAHDEGATIAELAPPGRVICRVNGGPGFVPRSQWHCSPRAGDVVEFFEYPFGGEDNSWGQVIVAAIMTIITWNPAPLFLAAVSIGAAMYAEQEPPELSKGESPTYAQGIQGNRARLYQPVPKVCGRCRFFPPYAAEPYREIRGDGEEYLYGLYALSIDGLDVERVQIEDTNLAYFSDVITSRYLAPGEQPQDVLANVLVSSEVGTQEMLTGKVIGPINICPPQFTVDRIGVLIVGPRGVGVADGDGNLSALEVSWRVDVSDINEFGTRISNWETLAIETRNVASREPIRWDTIYTLDPPRRVQVRVVRLDVKSSNVRHFNELVWQGLRAYLEEPAPLNPNVSHLEVIVRASKQLTGITQNRIAVIGTGYARELLPDGTQGDLIASRNAADYLADLHTSTTWGEGLDISTLDTATLVALKQKWNDRQDRFDYVFDTSIDANEAAQLIAGTGRARAFRRGGVRTFWRDELVTLPRVAITTRNTTKGSMSETEEFPRDRTPDGVIVEYFDNRTWNFGRPIECPCPGVELMEDPVRIRLAGITGRIHATREGLFEAAKLAYRRRVVSATVEGVGMLPAPGSAARWQSEGMRWVAGDVVEWAEDTLLARLSEPVVWDTPQKSIVFTRNDGTPSEPIAVTPGNLTTEVVLASSPGFDIVTEDGYRDRTQYLLGTPEEDEELVKLVGLSDGGTSEEGVQLYELAAFVDDERCHTVDLHLLPSPGEIQDPIEDDEGVGEETEVPVVNLTNQLLWRIGGADQYVQSTLQWFADGRLGWVWESGANQTYFPNQWLVVNPVDPETVSVLFEVRFTPVTTPDRIDGTEYFNTWLPANVNYLITANSDPIFGDGGVDILIEVRDAAQQIIQDSATISLYAGNGSIGD